MAETGAERRATPRVEVELDLQLARKVGRAVASRTVDISAGGARVVCARPLRIFEELQFDLSLGPDGRIVHGTARVLRQERHDVYALRFETVAADAAHELERFVAILRN